MNVLTSALRPITQPLSQWYSEINSATLTGAIDVLIIEQEDGSFQSSPFHVRFGKLGLLQAREKIVDIVINDEPVDIHMKLDETGAAFFVEDLSESEEEDDLPPELATSPLPGASPSPLKAASSANRSLIEEFNKVDELREVASAAKAELKGKLGRKKRKMRRAAAGAARHVRLTPTHGPASKEEGVKNSSESDEGEERSRKDGEHGSEIFDLEDNDNDGDCDEDEADVPRAAVTSTPHHNLTSKNDLPEQSFLGSRLGGEEIEDILKQEEKVKPKPVVEVGHYFSEPEMTPVMSPVGSRPSTPILSDSEFEVRRQTSLKDPSPEVEQEEEQSWEWGKLPTSASSSGLAASGQKESKEQKVVVSSEDEDEVNRQRSWTFSFWKSRKTELDVEVTKENSTSPGVYLDDLKDDEELMAIYLGRNKRNSEKEGSGKAVAIPAARDEDAESGNGPSLPMSPHSVEGAIGGGRVRYDSSDEEGKPGFKVLPDIAFSLCGGLDSVEEKVEVKGQEETEPTTPAKVTFSNQLFEQSLLTYDDFVARLKAEEDIFADPNLVVRIGDQFYTWKSACPIIMSAVLFSRTLPSELVQIIKASYQEARSSKESSTSPSNKTSRSSWWPFSRGQQPPTDVEGQVQASVENAPLTSTAPEQNPETNTATVIVDETLKVEVQVQEPEVSSAKTCKKTLRLNSDLIKKLNLRPGANEAEFSVTTAYQGTTRCKCHIYCWKHTDKIVISDIDGTITKSDVLGHVLPIIGRDWAQSGVASLFTKIVANGYHIVYLSARAIGQASVTKDYLSSIRQGNLNLPDGPLFLNPTSLINAFHREVIEKKPEKFKIACLRDIQKLWPEDKNPFYAGYGNRVNDVFAYTTVGIPISRIFTINSKGELRHELTQTFQTSYDCQSSIVDHIFPPIKGDDFDSPSHQQMYSSFTFWRDPIQDELLDVEVEVTEPPKVTPEPEVTETAEPEEEKKVEKARKKSRKGRGGNQSKKVSENKSKSNKASNASDATSKGQEPEVKVEDDEVISTEVTDSTSRSS